MTLSLLEHCASAIPESVDNNRFYKEHRKNKFFRRCNHWLNAVKISDSLVVLLRFKTYLTFTYCNV